jgi:hypothetical protein
MTEFHDLESIYQHLEDHAQEYKYPHQIGDIFQSMRDEFYKLGRIKESEICQIEIDVFNYVFRKGEMVAKFTGTDENGNPWKYPDISKLSENAADYLSQRAQSVINNILKARYSHILWNSQFKRQPQAMTAIDSYLLISNDLEKIAVNVPNDPHPGLELLNCIENTFALCVNVKYKIDDIKSKILNLILLYNNTITSAFALKYNLISLVLNNSINFQKDNILGFADICKDIAVSLESKSNIHGAITMLELGLKIDKQLNNDITNWNEEIAKLYEKLMIQAEGNENLAINSYCQSAIEHYKAAKNDQKSSELEKKYIELKQSMKLKKIGAPIDLSMHKKKWQETAKLILRLEPDEIVKFLMLDKNLLPNFKDIEKIAVDISSMSLVSRLFPTEVLDQKGNIAQHFDTAEEKKYFDMLQAYSINLGFKIDMLREVLGTIIVHKKLTAIELISFLEKNSWVSKRLVRKYNNDQEVEFCWLDLIAPSICHFFFQMERYYEERNNYPNLILLYDSLGLKFEGMLREILTLKGISTTNINYRDKGNRPVEREKDINALLHEQAIQDLVGEDDLLFYKFLFIEKMGYNLRHKIAHSLMILNEYTIEIGYLLFIAILRLSQYDITITPSENNTILHSSEE